MESSENGLRRIIQVGASQFESWCGDENFKNLDTGSLAKIVKKSPKNLTSKKFYQKIAEEWKLQLFVSENLSFSGIIVVYHRATQFSIHGKVSPGLNREKL